MDDDFPIQYVPVVDLADDGLRMLGIARQAAFFLDHAAGTVVTGFP